MIVDGLVQTKVLEFSEVRHRQLARLKTLINATFKKFIAYDDVQGVCVLSPAPLTDQELNDLRAAILALPLDPLPEELNQQDFAAHPIHTMTLTEALAWADDNFRFSNAADIAQTRVALKQLTRVIWHLARKR